MTKKIQEIAVAFFLFACGMGIVMGLLWIKPVIDSQEMLIEETRINQQKIMRAARETREIVTEAGFAVAVIAMAENRMLQPAEANKMLDQSIDTIKAYSPRLGTLATLVNEFRINQGPRRR